MVVLYLLASLCNVLDESGRRESMLYSMALPPSWADEVGVAGRYLHDGLAKVSERALPPSGMDPVEYE